MARLCALWENIERERMETLPTAGMWCASHVEKMPQELGWSSKIKYWTLPSSSRSPVHGLPNCIVPISAIIGPYLAMSIEWRSGQNSESDKLTAGFNSLFIDWFRSMFCGSCTVGPFVNALDAKKNASEVRKWRDIMIPMMKIVNINMKDKRMDREPSDAMMEDLK